jgi:hypothetical protein
MLASTLPAVIDLNKLSTVSRQQEWHRLRFLVRGEFQAVSWGKGNCLKSQISAP